MSRLLCLVLTVLFALTGCGFARAGDRGANKPDGFTLRGYVSVGSGVVTGSSCTSPASVDDVRAGGEIRVADEAGHTLGAGQLATGVPTTGRCDFGFEITNVRGGVDRYVIGVGTRPMQTFDAHALREGTPAVLRVDG